MQHLYISYPPDDYALAHRLVEDLQAAGYAVFIDTVNDVGTMAWAAETRRALRSCGAMLMILSLADRRRLGIRHEGVLAKRMGKPVVVLARSPGDLPRYLALAGASVIDFSGDYAPAFEHLRATLPPSDTLLIPTLNRPYRDQVPPARRRRRTTIALAILIMLVSCVLIGIVSGLIPV